MKAMFNLNVLLVCEKSRPCSFPRGGALSMALRNL